MRKPTEALRAELWRRLGDEPGEARSGHERDECRMPTGILDLCRALQA